jgi:hypothetical protein
MNINFIIAKITYHPRILIEYLIFQFIKNDWSILDKFRNKEVLIVGNGPSLNETNLERIDGVHIGMNKINLIFDRKKWRPDIIVCVNGLVLKQNKEFFNTTEIVLILPIKALFLGIKRRKNIIFIRSRSKFRFFSHLKSGLTPGATVTTNALQLASTLSATKVNIVGVDHNFSFKGNKHEIKKMETDDVNHFDKNYFKGNLWGLPDLDGSEKSYMLAKEYFDSQKIPIIDYTINGKLTVFPKGDINLIYNKTLS